ncbi:MAG: response regulator, partial [Thermomicrobia bacterium]|nr:response regulator [Thermomicrobia bacterium]
ANVLVVDDNPVNLRVCRLILERYGHLVETETSPVTVLARMATQVPDVLITDLMMPLLDGIELTRQIRALPTGRDLPIIVLTARGEESDQDRAMEAGATYFLTKPVSSGVLTAAVNDVLSPP